MKRYKMSLKLLYVFVRFAPLLFVVSEPSRRTEFIEGKKYVCVKDFNDQDLEMMSFDPIDNVILTTTSSKIFEIDSLDMSITKSESITKWLKTNGDEFVLNVLNHTEENVIACGNYNGGSCFKTSKNIEENNKISNSAIKALADDVHFKIVQDQLLIVNNPPVSQTSDSYSFINIYDIDKGFHHLAEIPAQDFIQTTAINSFKIGDYWYIFLNKKDSAHIIQVCSNGKSLAEVELVCGNGEDNYNQIISIDLHDKLLYGIFRKHDQEEAAICHYSFDKIEKDFVTVVEECLMKGEKVQNQMAKSSTRYSQYTQQCTNGHPKDFCNIEIYISSKHTVQISGNAFLKLDKMPSAMLGGYFKNAFVVFLAFDDQLFKLNISNDGRVKKYQRMYFNPPQRNQMMLFDNYQDLIVLREKEVCKVERAKCEYDSCGDCIADPHCVWCLNNRHKKCTLETTCMSKQRMKDKCPVITSIQPSNVTFNQFTSQKFVLHTSNIPEHGSEYKCRLLYTLEPEKETRELSVDAYPQESKFVCNEFSDLHVYYVGKLKVNISLFVDSLEWASSTIILYDCAKFSRIFNGGDDDDEDRRCTGCLSFEQCAFCLTRHTCQSKQDFCPEYPEKGHFPAPSLTDPHKCPYIKKSEKEKQKFSSGEKFTYRIQTFNLHSTSALECRFKFDEQEFFSPATMSNSGLVTCAETKLTYARDKETMAVEVDLVSNKQTASDNPDNVTIKLYKCHRLAIFCGRCNLLIGQDYDCRWCLKGRIDGKDSNGYCGHKEDCVESLSERSFCENPAINKIYPPGGPLGGGTELSIEGENLGMSAADVEVMVDGKPCEVIPEQYEPAKRIVCETPANDNRGDKTVLVSVNKRYTANAPKFFYENMQPISFDKNKGLLAGGTKITIYGKKLDYGSNVRVTFNDKQASIIERTSEQIIVKTPPMKTYGKVPVKVQVDNGQKSTLSQSFEYLSDPTKLDFNPTISFMAGGREIKLENYNHLNFVTSVVMLVYTSDCSYKNNCSFASEPCHFQRHEFICFTPEVRTSVDDSVYRNFKVVFKLDNFYYPSKEGKDTFSIKYYNNPELQHIPNNIRIDDVNAPFQIQFSENSRCVSGIMHDGWVKVGGEKCSKVVCGVNDTDLIFNPSDCKNTHEGGVYPIEIGVDNFKTNVGNLAFPKRGLAGGAIAGIVIAVLLALVVVLLALVCFYKRKLRGSSQSNKPPALHTVNFQSTSGVKENPYNSQPGSSEEEPLKSEYLNPNSFLNDEQYLNALLERLDNQSIRNAAKEIYIARERLELGNQLGKGHFGKVHAATLRDVNLKDPCLVAVKTIDDPDMDQKMIEGFLKEGVIMKNFNHPHVLNLIGLCLGFRKEPMVVLPFMANGDLRSYVKDKKRSFTARQLLKLAQQVCEGMSYLSSLNFIHRDLAARNCMIDDKSQVKVADFGLSHQLHDSEYYSSKNRKAKLPIKWMALESLENYVFTTKSDVWSFGVLLWELMTRGVTPYPDVDVFETRTYLASGRRLYKPKFCPDNVYAIMTECWQELPERRPTFTDLVNRIEILLNPPKAAKKEGSNYINVKDEEYAQDYLKPNVAEQRKDDVV